ncbi:starch phosphorylase [Steroidobacter denitrificans]|uniref:Starch phosphorylase n=2 Tax=Steroidobacter denitrificans TaxID=465721 RepID=A0A127FCG2_STEDE|nr:starch phosphorylase [Steroidobacter denitrificans]
MHLPSSDALYSFLPTDVDGFRSLAALALDMHWSWNHCTDRLWRGLDPALWDRTHNPWIVLQTISRERLRECLSDRGFRKEVDELLRSNRAAMQAPAWFQRVHGNARLTCVAFFSMEFMLGEALPIYSGGLGNVAGDQLKAASDLGVPVIGVGLLYQRGYFRQTIGPDGAQQALYPYNDPGQLPITPVRDAKGEWVHVRLGLAGLPESLRAWQVQVGRVTLYLLDSNDASNFPAHRGITSELYGGDAELRLKQEVILGIGGWRLLLALGHAPEVCHLNEGHAALAVLERARSFMQVTARSFDAAFTTIRAGNLFTTHTAVAAGFDVFAPALVERTLGEYVTQSLGIPVRDVLALGRVDPANRDEPFNMAYLAMRGSGAVNGVSRLHAAVSRRLFRPLFPRWPEHEVPVGHVTNGVHVPAWDSPAADALWTGACGKGRWRHPTEGLEQHIRIVDDAALWQLRTSNRAMMIAYVRQRLVAERTAGAAPAEAIKAANQVCDTGTLTLGFARRFATYKRPNLLLHDAERLLRLLDDPERPMQLIIAGKAHPADGAGQALIGEWMRFLDRPGARGRVVFLSDYDVALAEHLVQGVDLWINTPRRPWEASGTSGMKVLVNGGLNLSELDGWWAEAYRPEVGWAIGDGNEHGDDPAWDAIEAEQLYEILEKQVAPEFYVRDQHGIPRAWVGRMRASMASLTPTYSANRSVREYTERHYLPAAAAYLARAAESGARGEELARRIRAIEENWSALRFDEMHVESTAEGHAFHVRIDLGELDPEHVRVELYADGANGSEPIRWQMSRAERHTGADSTYTYTARVTATRPASDYTPRISPKLDAAVPLEAGRILWQR